MHTCSDMELNQSHTSLIPKPPRPAIKFRATKAGRGCLGTRLSHPTTTLHCTPQMLSLAPPHSVGDVCTQGHGGDVNTGTQRGRQHRDTMHM